MFYLLLNMSEILSYKIIIWNKSKIQTFYLTNSYFYIVKQY
jgi:hypothetical protein